MRWLGKGVKPSRNLDVVRKGSIIRAPITPEYGIKKKRRSIVLNPNLPDQDNPERRILVVGVLSDNEGYDPNDHVKYPPDLFFAMPYAADGTCPTSFTVPCAAKADWVQRFTREQLEERIEGVLSDNEVDELIKKISAYQSKEPPSGS